MGLTCWAADSGETGSPIVLVSIVWSSTIQMGNGMMHIVVITNHGFVKIKVHSHTSEFSHLKALQPHNVSQHTMFMLFINIIPLKSANVTLCTAV